MKWVELRARVEREVADDVAALLAQFGRGGAVTEEDCSGASDETPKFVTVKAYLPSDRTLRAKKRRLAEALGHLSLIYSVNLEERLLAEEDWAEAWKAHFHPLRVGRRLVIRPPWREYAPAEGDIIIELDPGMAFGTGLHPTTRLCLEALESRLQSGWEVLDLGTGSGIQALAAALLGAKRVLALDNDPIAVRVARANVKANHLSRKIAVRPGSLPLASASPDRPKAFDLVVANIIAGVIQELARPLVEATKPAGVLIAGGIISEKLAATGETLEQAGAAISDVLAEGDWRTIVATRRG
ncbi:MAG: 50S ribosomal protein L11 methyltransferase [Chloroflexi bacterium]|nr:50S ribosomal protein L11 methyltransferase [Chloroflexota bacterium]